MKKIEIDIQKVADGLKSSLFDYLKWIVPKNHPNVSAKVYEQAVKISDPRNDYVEISSPLNHHHHHMN